MKDATSLQFVTTQMARSRAHLWNMVKIGNNLLETSITRTAEKSLEDVVSDFLEAMKCSYTFTHQ